MLRVVRRVGARRSCKREGKPRVGTPQPVTDRENLAGLVERVTFHNQDSGFCVLRVKARGQRDLITVVGHAAAIGAGEFVQASGRWVNDRTHGVQFRADFLRSAPPTTAEGIEKYLASGMIKGIGPIYAKKLVRAFSEAVFDIIEQKPERLKEVDGIGPKRADSMVAALADQKAIREIMIFLHSHGVGTSRAVRIFKTYGADAIRLISENPYRLARDIRGIGFKSADQIASKLGIEKTAMIRARAGIGYALTEAMDDGHCGLPLAELVPMAVTLLEVPAAIIGTALDLELRDGEVVADTVDSERCIFLAGLHRAERTRPYPQESRIGVPGRRDPAHDAALSDAAAQPNIHRRHARQAPCGHRRAEEGNGDCGEGKADTTEVVEATRMAGRDIAVDWSAFAAQAGAVRQLRTSRA